MSHRSTIRGLIGSRGSALSIASIAALVFVVVLPVPVFAWSNYTFSATDESNFVTLINQYRASNGKPALTVDATVHSVARTRSKDMYDHNWFAHDGPDAGTTADAFEDLNAAGYCYTAAGENIAWNNYPDDQTTQVAFNGWVNSSTHRAIMLGNYTRIGIGAFKGDGRWAGSGTYGAENATYPVKVFTAVFTAPCGAPTPTPTPKPTPTPTAKPTPTPTPHPTPTPTPHPTATPTPTPTPTDGEPTPPAETASPDPGASPDASASPDPGSSSLPGFDSNAGSNGDGPANLRIWRGGGGAAWTGDGAGPEPTDTPAVTPPPGPSGTGLPSLQVVEPLPAVDLLDAVVAGVAGTYFGH